MELKNYQEKALYWLGRYYDRCRVLTEAGEANPTSSAFTLTTQEIYPAARASVFRGRTDAGHFLRFPTGGSKTLVGCEAIAVAQKNIVPRPAKHYFYGVRASGSAAGS